MLCYREVKATPFQLQADTFRSRIEYSLLSYYKNYPQEKVFIHTNEQVYANGETIWYKAYTMAYGKPGELSHILYVQLTDTAGNIIMQNKLPLVNGKGHGNIELDSKLKSGWYRLSAFTSWMMNFGPDGYYHQNIYIRNPGDPVLVKDRSISAYKQYHIGFYPEGGDIISGNLVKVAFKAYSDDCEPAVVQGSVMDNTDVVAATIATIHDGMGEFTVDAQPNSSYVANVKFPDGSRQSVKLPPVKESGIYLQAIQYPEAIGLKIAFAGEKEKLDQCTLAAFQNNGQVVTYSLHLLSGVNPFRLPLSVFTTGLLRLTIFDHDGMPRAERILFVNKHDLRPQPLKADTFSVAPRAMNSFSLTVKDNTGQPVKGNFSVAVTDEDSFNKADEIPNIFAGLLINPELKGNIHNPGYYFKNQDDSLARQFDLVMLTNGWRHFSWTKILDNESGPPKYPVERSQYIAGQVVGYHDVPGRDALKIKLIIANRDSTKFIGYAVPDTTGRFIVRDFGHAGISDVYLQTADKRNRAGHFNFRLLTSIDDSLRTQKAMAFADQPVPNLSGYYITAAQRQAEYSAFTNGIVLNAVSIKGEKVSPTTLIEKEHVSPKYRSDRGYTLDLVNNPTDNIGLVNYIRGRFPGLRIVGDNVFVYRDASTLGSPPVNTGAGSSNFQAEMSDNNSSFLPYCYLNEAPVQFVDIKDINLVELALIRYMPPPVWFAPYNGGNVGALMLYTKKQSDEISKVAGISGYDHFVFNGYSVAREFSIPAITPEAPSDNRVTLFWAHDINSNADGRVSFKFPNSDFAKKFRVIIQGMDAQGRLVYVEQRF